jgi:hypothetical protein
MGRNLNRWQNDSVPDSRNKMKKLAMLGSGSLGFVLGFVVSVILLGRYQIQLTQEQMSEGSETVCFRLDKFTGECDVNMSTFKARWLRLHEPPVDIDPSFWAPKKANEGVTAP